MPCRRNPGLLHGQGSHPIGQIQPAPRIGTHIRTDFIKGMGKRDTQFIMILDIDRVFSAEELTAVRTTETSKPIAEAVA